jgi:hypothetical protein
MWMTDELIEAVAWFKRIEKSNPAYLADSRLHTVVKYTRVLLRELHERDRKFILIRAFILKNGLLNKLKTWLLSTYVGLNVDRVIQEDYIERNIELFLDEGKYGDYLIQGGLTRDLKDCTEENPPS